MKHRSVIRLVCRAGAAAAPWLLVASAAAVDVPVASLDGWTSLAYRNIPPNDVSVSNGALRIAVKRSAGPLVHRLPAPRPVTSVTVKARWTGSLDIPQGAVQGGKDADDFVFRLGLVEAGEQTLNWFQRRIAADWVVQLHQLAPQGSGVRRINFLTTTQQQTLVGTSRVHPLSDLLHETRVVHLEKPGEFELTYTFAEPVQTLGLWISSDGDDTGSAFEVYVERIALD